MKEQSNERIWLSERNPCRRNAGGQGNDSGFLHHRVYSAGKIWLVKKHFFPTQAMGQGMGCIHSTGSVRWDISAQ